MPIESNHERYHVLALHTVVLQYSKAESSKEFSQSYIGIYNPSLRVDKWVIAI